MNKSQWLLLLSFLHTALCDTCSQVTPSTRSCSVEGQVCIIQTSTLTASNAGRVQICRSGLWGTVAGDNLQPWGEKNAQVACRQAGFSGAINSIFPNSLENQDRATSDVPIHYSGVECQGSESSILNCTISSRLVSGHLLDAFVVCRPQTIAYSDIHPAGEQVGDLRLYGDTGDGQGAVEIFTTFGWSSICPDGFDSSDAVVICQQFGYDTGSVANIDVSSLQRSTPLIRRLSNAECTESGPGRVNDITAINAGKCRFEILTGTCPSQSPLFAGVRCSSPGTQEGAIRLFGGTSSLAGIVEVFYDNRWGPVCRQTSFALTEARTVCTQLGLSSDGASSMSATSLLDEESAMKAIWLRGVDCSSSDASFTGLCDIGVIGYGECRTSSLAAVQCGDSSPGGLSSGAITGIVFAVIFLVFFLLPLGYYFGKDYWQKRHQYGWYNRLTTPSEWCDCCSLPAPSQRTFNLRSERTEVTIDHQVTLEDVEPTTDHSFGGFTGQRTRSSSASSSSVDRQPSVFNDTQEDDPGLTKAPPPAYYAAENFPSVSSLPQDLPPPYTGPEVAPPPLGFAFPPPTSVPPPGNLSPAYPPPTQAGLQGTAEASAPPPTAPGPAFSPLTGQPSNEPSAPLNPAYPPPTQAPEPSAPPPGPAYPPPTYSQPGQGQTSSEASAPPPSSGYPTDTQPDPAHSPPPAGPDLPYPVNLEYGGGAYPPPTTQQEPSS